MCAPPDSTLVVEYGPTPVRVPAVWPPPGPPGSSHTPTENPSPRPGAHGCPPGNDPVAHFHEPLPPLRMASAIADT
ncbi:hypothetical protein FNU77_24175 [Prescottella equi]|nr:hypothetical protein FNU77_24175 [Prescottella equi]